MNARTSFRFKLLTHRRITRPHYCYTDDHGHVLKSVFLKTTLYISNCIYSYYKTKLTIELLALCDLQVCSRDNVTYDTECHLDRDHCLCKTKHAECSNPGNKYVRLDYYSGCKGRNSVTSI